MLLDHGLKMHLTSSTALDLSSIMGSEIVPVQAVANSNGDSSVLSNTAVMLTSRRHQISTLLSFNIVHASYGAC